MTMTTGLLVAALVLFAIAALNPSGIRQNLTAAGLALVTLAQLISVT